MDQQNAHANLHAQVEKNLTDWALPWLKRFVDIPNLSRNYDPEWNTNGLLEKACQLCMEYAKAIDIKGLNIQLCQDEGATPIVFGVIEPTKSGTTKNLMVYGHIDKQPHMADAWSEGLFPAKAVEKDGLIYGRGVVDDGYNFFSILAMVKSLQELNIEHDRFVLFYECDEESASIDVPRYMEKFKTEIGIPDILFCLDGGSASNQLFSLTTSLRGAITIDLKVSVLKSGIHSGLGTGLCASSFRVIRDLLDRIEDVKTGQMIKGLQVDIPPNFIEESHMAAKILGDGIKGAICFADGVSPVSDSTAELIINNTWKPGLEIIGQDGIPHNSESGNVLRKQTTLRLSVRLPPRITSDQAFQVIKNAVTKDPLYGAQVECTLVDDGDGWATNPIPDPVRQLLHKNSMLVFGTPTLMLGGAGSIPFIKTIQDQLPNTLMFVSGTVLPNSSIHGPDECLDVEYLKRFMKTVSGFLVEYSQLPNQP